MDSKIRTFLNKEYTKRKKKSANYSIRSFARFLEIEPSSLSQMLKGTRKISFESAAHLLDRLNVRLDIKNALLLSLSDEKQHHDAVTKTVVINKVDVDFFSSWEVFAVYAALDIDPELHSFSEIQKNVGLSPDRTRFILDKLIEFGLVEKLNHSFKKPLASLHFEDDESGFEETFTRSVFEKSLAEINCQSNETLHDSWIVAIDEADFQEAFRRIREFKRGLVGFLTRGKIKKVYALTISLFPVKATTTKT